MTSIQPAAESSGAARPFLDGVPADPQQSIQYNAFLWTCTKYNRFVQNVVRELSGACAAIYQPNQLSLDRIRAMVGRIVHDPTCILRGESSSETRPTAPSMPGPSATSARSLLPSQGAGVTLNVLTWPRGSFGILSSSKFAVPLAPVPQPAPEPVTETAPTSTAPSASTTGEREPKQEKLEQSQPRSQMLSVALLRPMCYAGIPIRVAVKGRRDDLLRETEV